MVLYTALTSSLLASNLTELAVINGEEKNFYDSEGKLTGSGYIYTPSPSIDIIVVTASSNPIRLSAKKPDTHIILRNYSPRRKSLGLIEIVDKNSDGIYIANFDEVLEKLDPLKPANYLDTQIAEKTFYDGYELVNGIVNLKQKDIHKRNKNNYGGSAIKSKIAYFSAPRRSFF